MSRSRTPREHCKACGRNVKLTRVCDPVLNHNGIVWRLADHPCRDAGKPVDGQRWGQQ